jgi:hypothetical protein
MFHIPISRRRAATCEKHREHSDGGFDGHEAQFDVLEELSIRNAQGQKSHCANRRP